MREELGFWNWGNWITCRYWAVAAAGGGAGERKPWQENTERGGESGKLGILIGWGRRCVIRDSKYLCTYFCRVR